MRVAVVCECGQTTDVDDATLSAARCPVCGRLLTNAGPRAAGSTSESLPARGMFQRLWQSHQQGDEITPAAATPPLPAAARSLWDVMSKSDVVPADDAAKPKGLWDVMQAVVPEVKGQESEVSDQAEARDEKSAEQPVILAEPQRPAVPQSIPKPLRVDPELTAEWSSRAIAAFLFTVATLIFGVLSLLPGLVVRFPPLVCGVVAVVVGFLASGDVRRSRGKLKGRGLAISAVVLGASGMFLAPMLFARWGEQQRELAAFEATAAPLRRIGAALDRFHAEHGHFPAAVAMGGDQASRVTPPGPPFGRGGNAGPLHGWMTPLLPQLGQAAVFQQIDLNQSFDAPANIIAMQQIIPEFTLPGRQPLRNQRGFGITHLAGVGGEDVVEPIGVVHLGIFNEGGAVRREQVTDGLANTLIVGEISQSLPAWGEPGNIRSIGDGINKAWNGFGNSAGTGATFLHGDGSVKFYSTKTDPRVLKQLSTRDGEEPLP